MGVKIFGYSPSSVSHTDPSGTRDLPVFQISGMSSSFGAIPVCLYVYSSNTWVPCHHNWLS